MDDRQSGERTVNVMFKIVPRYSKAGCFDIVDYRYSTQAPGDSTCVDAPTEAGTPRSRNRILSNR